MRLVVHDGLFHCDEFQYRSRVTPFAAGSYAWHRRFNIVSIPQQGYPLCGYLSNSSVADGKNCFNTAIGYPPMRRVGGIGLRIPCRCFNTAIGHPPMRQDSFDEMARQEWRFNTATGYHPMRLRYWDLSGFRPEFQYRNRVSPHAA